MKTIFRAVPSGLFAAALLISNADADTVYRDISITVEQSEIVNIGEDAPVPASIKVSAWLDRENATYRPGDAVTLQVRTSKPAYITVLDVGTSGKVHVIYPNRYQREKRVEAFEVVQIPTPDERYRFTVNGPAGREVLKVIATEKPIDTLDARRLSEAGPFYAVPGEARAIARDISVELTGKQSADYGVATQIFRIVTDGAAAKPETGGGDNAAQLFNLAEAAYYGETKQSIGAVVEYYERAAKAGHVAAMVRLGDIYQSDANGKPQILRAVEWYRKAADLGSTTAMVRLAIVYGKGEGVAQNLVEALNWLDKAARGGDGVALAQLAQAYDEGRWVARNPTQAARYGLAALRAGAWSIQKSFPAYSQPTREEVQKLLKEAGLYSGPIDGVFGLETREALLNYARA
ncbi:Peptidoglycan-binding domain 1 protein [Rhodomicrobium vannielii ATCC 17100]|uniref:Peptidoglycan-binding domain 1 protein n=1 Tax=Rhodomicrobium vannielii (strain ATCC 17100 / DSM 162 / LMG 4299 / NCIMB 10020 / ATH 3.1.1) TaxID=648757 RepID=E3I563_RHOVT|nr:DUF4384 domain-containing protein [Rhodomicrobium vannielii]ADP70513.1 Peptidoglycan-binding domain 1 protein [Rhodomicrobium vannielii ATCC 17100]